MLQQFITSAAQKLGAQPDQVESATGGILSLIKSKADGADFGELLQRLPGAAAALEKAPAAEAEASGGLLSGVASLASSAIGGKAAGAAGVVQKLLGSGLDAGKIGSLVPMFVDFAKQNVGKDVIGRILKKVPDLAALVS